MNAHIKCSEILNGGSWRISIAGGEEGLGTNVAVGPASDCQLKVAVILTPPFVNTTYTVKMIQIIKG